MDENKKFEDGELKGNFTENEDINNNDTVNNTESESNVKSENVESSKVEENTNDSRKKVQSELKKQTMDTFNAAKEQMKNINFKEEASAGKNLIVRLFKEPLEVIKETVKDENNRFLKTSILFVAVWLIVILIDRILFYNSLKYTDFNFLATLKGMLSPILQIAAMTLLIYFLNKKKDKSITNIITPVVISKIPLIFSAVIFLLSYISDSMSYIISPISKILSVVSIILGYFVIKYVTDSDEDNDSFMMYIKVIGLYYAVYFILSFMGIYI